MTPYLLTIYVGVVAFLLPGLRRERLKGGHDSTTGGIAFLFLLLWPLWLPWWSLYRLGKLVT